jgi:lipopolysaccharide/colanic/teichoic acid biosynthesis glycosyltransferase
LKLFVMRGELVNAMGEIVERVAAALGLVLLLPVLLVLGAWVLFESGSPILFRQVRVGRDGRPFVLFKFRSMRAGSGTRITAGGDDRITAAGKWLRKFKLDELPQLWNIAAGDMRLIGPRPDVPAFVEMGDPLWRQILGAKPGLTDLASLVYRDEERILATYADTERAYREQVLPAKLALSASYMRERSFASDCRLLVLTARYSFVPSGFDPERIKSRFLKGS